MLRFTMIFAGFFCCALALHAQTSGKPVPAEKPADRKGAPVAPPSGKPQGVYATINIQPMEEIRRRLESSSQRSGAAREVLKNPGAQMPPVLYALANVMSGDRPEESIFWYHVGRVRAVYDAFRCKDATARNLIPELGKRLSPELIHSQFYQRERLVGISKKAIEWDAKNPRNYDQRWVCLSGRVAQTSAGTDPSEVQKPESEWPAILKHIHEAHLLSVQEFAAQPPPNR